RQPDRAVRRPLKECVALDGSANPGLRWSYQSEELVGHRRSEVRRVMSAPGHRGLTATRRSRKELSMQVGLGFTPSPKWVAVTAVTGVAVLAIAGCGGGGDDGAAAASGAKPSNGIAGKRLTMMVQNSPTANKVVEVHAIDLLKKQGVDASI